MEPHTAATPPESVAPRAARPRAGRRSFEQVAPAVIFFFITVYSIADFVGDVMNGESGLHLAGMAFGIAMSLTGLIFMLRILARSRAHALALTTALDHTRADSARWREQAAEMLQGLGALIDRQFVQWSLSPSEREVGLLILKGLSLKDIATVRGASEATVRQQAQAIYRKSELAGRAELSAFFLEDLLLPRTEAAQTPAPRATLENA